MILGQEEIPPVSTSTCGEEGIFLGLWGCYADLILCLTEWRPAVILAAIDCADEDNQQVCSDFGITGFPTLKVRLCVLGTCWVPLCFAFWPGPLLLNRIDRGIAPKCSPWGFAGCSCFNFPQNNAVSWLQPVQLLGDGATRRGENQNGVLWRNTGAGSLLD